VIVLAAAGVGDRFADTVTSGSFVAALGVAVVAGLVSFGSPCMLPLVPGYLSYVAGLSGADVTARENGETGRRGRVLAGAALFVAGFTAVFVSYGAAFGNLGAVLVQHQRAVEGVLGAVTVLFGLAFLGLVPLLQREVRIRRLPSAGLSGAPLLGWCSGSAGRRAWGRRWARCRRWRSARRARAAARCCPRGTARVSACRSSSPRSGCAAGWASWRSFVATRAG